jgi:FlaA1/EpsC-like NDP-sugar epimerase
MATLFLKEPKVSHSWKARILSRPAQFALDLTVLVGAFVITYLLRYDFVIPSQEIRHGLTQLPFVVSLQFTLLIVFGVYAFIWRYIGIAEVKAFANAALWSALPLLVLRVGLPEQYQSWRVPLSVIVVDTIIAFSSIIGVRVLRRIVYEQYEIKQKEAYALDNQKKKSILLIGAGRAGVLAAKEIQNRGDIDLVIKGFVDDDTNKRRAVVHGVKVLGTTQDLPRLVRELEIDHVVISIAQASRQNFRRILDICEQIPVKVRIIPGLYEILQGKVKVSRIRDIQIEDLLGREPVQLDEQNLLDFLSGKRVMVTGAGGSIGSELARQIARFGPASMLLVERAEFALFNVERELREATPSLSIIPLVADICDEARMRHLFSTYEPQVILHAAAHKHVPMMETNPTEAVKNNVLGTRRIGELAGEFGVEVFVLISTDKAVRPKSIMGATKRVAELVVQNLNECFRTRYVAVRFGNVIGSAGSVIPIFRDQIRKGGPVTVTHKDMKRYFMTIPEAAQLVLQAGAMGEGGEIFILDMGEPVSILDLAKETINLSGLRPYEDIDIVFTGLRAGEKLFEELDTAEERMTKTRHPKIFIGKIAPYPEEQVQQALHRLIILSKGGHEPELYRFLSELLPEAELEINNTASPPPEVQVLWQETVA